MITLLTSITNKYKYAIMSTKKSIYVCFTLHYFAKPNYNIARVVLTKYSYSLLNTTICERRLNIRSVTYIEL